MLDNTFLSNESDPAVLLAEGSHELSLIASNSCGSDTSSETILILNASPVFTENHFTIAPNPVNDYLFIESEKEFKYALYSIDGKLMAWNSVAANKAVLSVLELQKGIYILKLMGKDGEESRKVVKM
jgi:hypothetical protein